MSSAGLPSANSTSPALPAAVSQTREQASEKGTSWQEASESVSAVRFEASNTAAPRLPACPPELLLACEALQQGCCRWVVNLGISKDAPRQLQVRLQHLLAQRGPEGGSRTMRDWARASVGG